MTIRTNLEYLESSRQKNKTGFEQIWQSKLAYFGRPSSFLLRWSLVLLYIDISTLHVNVVFILGVLRTTNQEVLLF